VTLLFAAVAYNLQDPWPKPCYLFSAVAGDLSVKEGSHTIASTGKRVAVRIYTAPMYEGQVRLGTAAAPRAPAPAWPTVQGWLQQRQQQQESGSTSQCSRPAAQCCLHVRGHHHHHHHHHVTH
jgi:hypothetical protein